RARAHQIVSEPTRMIDVSSDVGICELANVLHKCVEALSSPLQELLELLICDGPAGRFAYHALCDWQVTSQRCTMDDMERELHSVLETMRSVKGAHEREVMLENSARKLARLTDISEEECRQRLVELLSQDEAELKLRIVVYQLAKARGDEKLFCDQTAHVLIGRLLLYRVMEDKGIVQRAISGEPLKRELKASAVQEHPLFTPPRRFIHIYQQAREHVAELSPAIYRLSVYDWWLVWDVNVEGMQRERRVRMRRIQGQMDCTLCNVLRMLNRFDFRDVNGDVWRDVYQRYLPSEERLRLGGFYTPPQLVRMVLKLAGYDGSGKLLDPACGSGTFLVEAMRMARECEERRMKGTRKARRMQIILK
ncbi:MAG TPA: hypothetical protein EYP10_12560, partial [Armatimonadetes bacterium]|nr:hypothetical protein [Armatimonadota bacterium]